MSFILEALTDYLNRDLCASDDCIIAGDTSGEIDVKSPLFDIAIGELDCYYCYYTYTYKKIKIDHTALTQLFLFPCIPYSYPIPSFSHHFRS